jgi:hypothetical protein
VYVYSVVAKPRKVAYGVYDPKLRIRFRFVARKAGMTGGFIGVSRQEGYVVFFEYADDHRLYKMSVVRRVLEDEERALFLRPRPHRCM